MIKPRDLMIRQKGDRNPNGIGGFDTEWKDKIPVKGYIDLVTGTDKNTAQNSFTEQSTHMGIIPKYTDGIKSGMRLMDLETGRWYHIDYVDDPMSIHHHIELYMTYGGESNGK